MEIGNKIQNLRKQKNMTQEVLAEKMGVARQTISKWELGETSPDLEQSKQLSQIFNISLDDLTNNEIKNILITKVSNTEKLSKIIINILKIIFLVIIILVIVLVAIIFFQDYFDAHPTSIGESITCTINGEEYIYEAWAKYETRYIIDSFYTNDKELSIDSTKYTSIDLLLEDVKEYVISRGGSCELQIEQD